MPPDPSWWDGTPHPSGPSASVQAPTSRRREAWAAAKEILCVRLDTMGDVLMTSPALRALRGSDVGASLEEGERRLTLLTSSQGAEAAALIPELSEVWVYDAPWMKATAPRRSSEPDLRMIDRLRGFDAAVIFTVYSQNPLPAALMCYLAGIPLRLAHCRENPYQLLTDWVPDLEPGRLIRHEVQRQLELVAAVGVGCPDRRIRIRTSPEARARVRGLLKGIGFDFNRPWVVVHPGASAPSRRYPCGSFVEVARLLVQDLAAQVVFTGDRAERSLVESIRADLNVATVSLAGQLSLAELAALVEMAPLLVSNNTAPVHIAAGTGTPVVDLYALTNPQHKPWLVPSRVLSHDVPCKFCYRSVCPQRHHDCLRLVPPAAVVEAARELLAI